MPPQFKQTCKRGHALAVGNLYVTGTKRRCAKCKRDWENSKWSRLMRERRENRNKTGLKFAQQKTGI